MPFARFHTPRRYLNLVRTLRELARWIPLATGAGALGGTASALLLVSLDLATRVRESHHWLILLLGPAGFAVGLLYHVVGRRADAGNNLILEEAHDPKATLPLRMTPLILLGTFLTHLFGGSAGREGTALQTGASLADQMAKPLALSGANRRILLMAGISAGFGSVFGTPLAGAVFGFEVLAIGSLSYEGLVPCFIAAFIGDLTTRSWGLHHTLDRVESVPAMSLGGFLTAAAAGIVFGLVALAFVRAAHAVSAWMKRRLAYPPLRPLLGGLIVSAGVFALGTTRYIGLGIGTTSAAFHQKLPVYDFLGKMAFTVMTLGANFKGGEVTPLFFIGATLGNALSRALPLPMSLMAGMGFVGVFAGASNTPIASTLMAVELFGAEAGAYAGIACVFSYLFSGHSGIYQAQRIGRGKWGMAPAVEEMPLAEAAKEEAPADQT